MGQEICAAPNLRQVECMFGNNRDVRKDIHDIFKDRFAELMAERDLKPQHLRARGGPSPSTISEALSSTHSPSLETVQKIADAIGVEVWELLVKDEETRERKLREIMGGRGAATR